MTDDLNKMKLEIERERLEIERIRVENELEIKKLEIRGSSFTNPLFLGVCAAALGLISNALIAFLNGEYQRELEKTKTESSLILESVKTEGDREAASMNLQFLVESGLVKDPTLTERIQKLVVDTTPTLPGANKQSNLTLLQRNPSFRTLLVLHNGNIIRGKRWSLDDDFFERTGKIDFNLSGGACIDEHFCVVIGDRNHYATRFSLALPNTISPHNDTIENKEKILLSATEEKLDIEAVAYEKDYFLFVGSHSVSRENGCRREQRHGVYLLPKPNLVNNAFNFSEGALPVGIKKASLDYILSQNKIFSPFYDMLLQRGGVNIEGAALDGDTVLFGIRAPSGVRKIRLLKLRKSDFFEGKEPEPDILEIDVDREGIGIRDMVKVKNGFLFLTGDSHAEAPPDLMVECDHKDVLKSDNPKRTVGNGKNVGNPFELYFWNGKNSKAQLIGTILGTFPNIEDIVKAEGLVVLPRPWSSEEAISILIFFDGINNGAPTSFEIPLSLLSNTLGK